MARGEDDRLMARLGYDFRDPLLLDRALTHSSAIPELRAARGEDIAFSGSIVQDNERLEFLGDAVLELLTSEYLLLNYPEWTEGQLSKSRARIVNAHSLEIAARGLRLGEHLRLGRGEEKTGGREKPALLADAFEAIVAAMYLDGGLGPARNLLKRTVFEQALEDGVRISESDRKSALQEFLQAKGDQPAEYRLAGETGPDHQKTFRVEVWVKGEFMSSAEGTTKKEAEQKAARSALDKLLSTEAKQGEEVGPNAG
ncbi:MAG TPA: ribonuclease III [Candidatus Sulfotelmatobacter sp.]|jgi:ribonuclease-3|nr:ribonuclease III [Candidatus Sulfotelmatobacter sp.]